MSAPGGGGAGQAGLAEEFRTLADAVLDRLQPWVDQLCAAHQSQPRTGDRSGDDARIVPAACAVCPICAVIAAARGERSELGARLAEQAAALLAALRAALHEGRPERATDGEQPPTAQHDEPSGAARRAQPIVVERADPQPGPPGGKGSPGAC
jgi:hypothetical protein